MTVKKKQLWAALIALNLAFIWGNSMVTGTDSGNLSGGVLAWLNGFLGLDESSAEVLHLLIRKGAHFAEFACLGLLLTRYCQLGGEKHGVAFPVLLAMAAAVVDESIQMFTPDRGPSLVDVWIDGSGALTGTMLLFLGQILTTKKHK